METITLTLTGCSGGVGVGLDNQNCVDMLKKGMPAEEKLEMGDKITHWNGIAMYDKEIGQRKLKDVVKPAESHVLVIERARKWEMTTWETGSWETGTWETSKW